MRCGNPGTQYETTEHVLFFSNCRFELRLVSAVSTRQINSNSMKDRVSQSENIFCNMVRVKTERKSVSEADDSTTRRLLVVARTTASVVGMA